MKKILLASLLALSLTACFPMSDNTARRALEAQGYTEIQLHGVAAFGCGDDWFRAKFTATGVNGKRISGVVCGGILKGATVRLN